MDEYSDIWIEECAAARDIRDAWGTNKALGYLIGDKFLNYLRASDMSSDWREKIPLFTTHLRSCEVTRCERGTGLSDHTLPDNRYTDNDR
jgi:hypothetical protein